MAVRSEARLGYVPHFEVTTLDGQRVQYDDIWQRRNLVLVLASPADSDAAARFVSQLQTRRDEFEQADTALVVTADSIPELTAPRVVVADRWGEIVHVEAPPAGPVSSFPSVDELLSWVHFVRIQCPECPP